jgi:alkanesulfonate monooxygenase SsuD/methylene tetrahydromethanopterin reductase-like flavin-dependent oxidoreductase (luciferase family)
MQFGISVTGGHYNYDSTPQDFVRMIQERIEWVRAARDAGFSSVSMGQHVLGEPPRHMLPQIIPMLARFNAEAPQMRMMTSILIGPLYNPVMLAEEVSTLDGLTNGNFTLVLGLGYREHEFLAFDTTKRERVPRTEELVEVLKLMWTRERVDFDGRYFHVHGPGLAHRIVAKPYPRLWFGTGSDAGMQRAARLGDGVYQGQFAPLKDLERQLSLYRAALREQGKSPDSGSFNIAREVYLGESRAKVLEQALPGFQKTLASYKAAGVEDTMLPGFLVGADAGARADEFPFLMGSAGECAEQIARYRERLDLDWINLGFTSSGIPHAQVLRNIETFGAKVLPQLR